MASYSFSLFFLLASNIIWLGALVEGKKHHSLADKSLSAKPYHPRLLDIFCLAGLTAVELSGQQAGYEGFLGTLGTYWDQRSPS